VRAGLFLRRTGLLLLRAVLFLFWNVGEGVRYRYWDLGRGLVFDLDLTDLSSWRFLLDRRASPSLRKRNMLGQVVDIFSEYVLPLQLIDKCLIPGVNFSFEDFVNLTV